MRLTKTIIALLFAAATCLAQQPYHNSLTWRANQWVPPAGMTNCGGVFDTNTIAWGALVVANGGAAVSSTTSNALNCFYLGCEADNLWTNLDEVILFVPDNFIAATTPFKIRNGAAPLCTNLNFVAGDLSTNGLTGDGTTKSLQMAVSTATAQGSLNVSLVAGAYSAGISIYRAPSTNNWKYAVESGRGDSTAYSYFRLDTSGTEILFCAFGNEVINRDYLDIANPWGTQTNWAGFISGSRTAQNAIALYCANTTTPFTTLTNGNGVNTTINSAAFIRQEYLFAIIRSTLAIDVWSAHTLSFYASHRGLDASQTEKLYNRVLSLRYQLGGGYQ